MRTIQDAEQETRLNNFGTLPVDQFFARNRLQTKDERSLQEIPKTSDFDDTELYYGFEGICAKEGRIIITKTKS
jgi:hypothetical protein